MGASEIAKAAEASARIEHDSPQTDSPTNSPTDPLPGGVKFPNRCVWGGVFNGACNNEEHMPNHYCDENREQCIGDCAGTWCGDVHADVQSASPYSMILLLEKHPSLTRIVFPVAVL